ncbi:MAG: hypothetical protein LBU28_03880 [Spirochaetaceae bacterium]|nr:hypothetical protein [Spirochaetaceae bacterium]
MGIDLPDFGDDLAGEDLSGTDDLPEFDIDPNAFPDLESTDSGSDFLLDLESTDSGLDSFLDLESTDSGSDSFLDLESTDSGSDSFPDLESTDSGSNSFPELENTDDLPDFDISMTDDLPDIELPPEPPEADADSVLEGLPDFEDAGDDLSSFTLPEELAPEDEAPLGEEPDAAGIPDEPSFSLETDDMFGIPDAEEPLPDAGFEDAPPDDSGFQECEPPLTDVSMEDFLDNTPFGSVPPLLDDPVVEAPFPERSREEDRVSPGMDLSTQLLMRIADELSLIKVEISTLKEELSSHRGSPSPREEPKDTEQDFFDEEEDEKIALTGDEIDNILNTADFTEEAGTDAAAEFPEDAAPEEELPETGEADLSTPEAFPEISFEESAGDEAFSEEPASEAVFAEAVPVEFPGDAAGTEDFGGTGSQASEEPDFIELPEIDDNFAAMELPGIPGDSGLPPDEGFLPLPEEEPEELKLLREEGATIITEEAEDLSYPEDISYLEEDALGPDVFDEAALDLSEAVIDEPNISGDLVENVLEEPTPDSIAINLDMEEPLGPEASGEGRKPFILPEDSGDFFIKDENAVELLHEDEEKTIDIAVEPEAAGQDGEPPAEAEGLPETELLAEAEFLPETEFLPEAEAAPAVFEIAAEEAGDSQGPDDFPVFEEAADRFPEPVPEETAEPVPAGEKPPEAEIRPLPDNLKQELKVVLSYMDQLLESLPDEKIEEFARSEHFNTYKKLFEELGLV